MVKRIVADPKKCMACRACEIACALAHVETDDLVEAIAQGAKPRIYIEAAGSFAVPLQCRHCEDAPCLRVCPSAAISREGDDQPVLVDPERCIGCGYCVEACPFGIIRLARRAAEDTSGDGLAVVKCDLCIARQAEGLQPACVSACPVSALFFVELEESTKKLRAKVAAAAIADGDL
jgi:carbon-monoxide dehydrogenase iron sulfur subunit